MSALPPRTGDTYPTVPRLTRLQGPRENRLDSQTKPPAQTKQCHGGLPWFQGRSACLHQADGHPGGVSAAEVLRGLVTELHRWIVVFFSIFSLASTLNHFWRRHYGFPQHPDDYCRRCGRHRRSYPQALAHGRQGIWGAHAAPRRHQGAVGDQVEVSSECCSGIISALVVTTFNQQGIITVVALTTSSP